MALQMAHNSVARSEPAFTVPVLSLCALGCITDTSSLRCVSLPCSHSQALTLRMWRACLASVTSCLVCTTCQLAAGSQGSRAWMMTTGQRQHSSSSRSRRLTSSGQGLTGPLVTVAAALPPAGLLRCVCAHSSSCQAGCLSATGWTMMRRGQCVTHCVRLQRLRCRPRAAPLQARQRRWQQAAAAQLVAARALAVCAVRTAGPAAGRAAPLRASAAQWQQGHWQSPAVQAV